MSEIMPTREQTDRELADAIRFLDTPAGKMRRFSIRRTARIRAALDYRLARFYAQWWWLIGSRRSHHCD